MVSWSIVRSRRLTSWVRLQGNPCVAEALPDIHRGTGEEGSGWSSNGWLYFFASGSAVTSSGAWPPGDGAAGLLRLDVDHAVDIVPTTLAAN
jgi:hypothetical protein